MKEDLRVRRTREAIQKTFQEMLQEMDYEKITIKELTRRANINRRTFYLHYSVLDELLNELIDQFTDDCLNALKGMDIHTNLPEMIRTFITYLCQQDSLREKVVCYGNFRYICDRITLKLFDRGQPHIHKLGKSTFDSQSIIFTYLNASALEMYRRWVSDRKRIPQEEFIDLAADLICSGILGVSVHSKNFKV